MRRRYLELEEMAVDGYQDDVERLDYLNELHYLPFDPKFDRYVEEVCSDQQEQIKEHMESWLDDPVRRKTIRPLLKLVRRIRSRVESNMIRTSAASQKARERKAFTRCTETGRIKIDKPSSAMFASGDIKVEGYSLFEFVLGFETHRDPDLPAAFEGSETSEDGWLNEEVLHRSGRQIVLGALAGSQAWATVPAIYVFTFGPGKNYYGYSSNALRGALIHLHASLRHTGVNVNVTALTTLLDGRLYMLQEFSSVGFEALHTFTLGTTIIYNSGSAFDMDRCEGMPVRIQETLLTPDFGTSPPYQVDFIVAVQLRYRVAAMYLEQHGIWELPPFAFKDSEHASFDEKMWRIILGPLCEYIENAGFELRDYLQNLIKRPWSRIGDSIDKDFGKVIRIAAQYRLSTSRLLAHREDPEVQQGIRPIRALPINAMDDLIVRMVPDWKTNYEWFKATMQGQAPLENRSNVASNATPSRRGTGALPDPPAVQITAQPLAQRQGQQQGTLAISDDPASREAVRRNRAARDRYIQKVAEHKFASGNSGNNIKEVALMDRLNKGIKQARFHVHEVQRAVEAGGTLTLKDVNLCRAPTAGGKVMAERRTACRLLAAENNLPRDGPGSIDLSRPVGTSLKHWAFFMEQMALRRNVYYTGPSLQDLPPALASWRTLLKGTLSISGTESLGRQSERVPHSLTVMGLLQQLRTKSTKYGPMDRNGEAGAKVHVKQIQNPRKRKQKAYADECNKLLAAAKLDKIGKKSVPAFQKTLALRKRIFQLGRQVLNPSEAEMHTWFETRGSTDPTYAVMRTLLLIEIGYCDHMDAAPTQSTRQELILTIQDGEYVEHAQDIVMRGLRGILKVFSGLPCLQKENLHFMGTTNPRRMLRNTLDDIGKRKNPAQPLSPLV
ncbi:hypothetical protein QFC20_007764 [Naganishia adeliensis]|uniref:Uncharacterized protein n=1 Tax=Naganishia adeliensis TaxID=92952 RepID=A0ACC2UWJ7_9TREE|nr:hypothetical protein QFC20_007764 [Naganishia adeliensis]